MVKRFFCGARELDRNRAAHCAYASQVYPLTSRCADRTRHRVLSGLIRPGSVRSEHTPRDQLRPRPAHHSRPTAAARVPGRHGTTYLAQMFEGLDAVQVSLCGQVRYLRHVAAHFLEGLLSRRTER